MANDDKIRHFRVSVKGDRSQIDTREGVNLCSVVRSGGKFDTTIAVVTARWSTLTQWSVEADRDYAGGAYPPGTLLFFTTEELTAGEFPPEPEVITAYFD